MIAETFQRSLWSALSPGALNRPPLQMDARCDVLIVGAGLLGLSTALHLAEGGVKVTLLEAREVGFGASGRNTGFVVPSLRSSIGPTSLAERLGPVHGARLGQLIGASGATVFDLIRRLGIACQAEQTGWLQPAHSAPMAEVLRQRCGEWNERGQQLEYLSARATLEKCGIPGYHGALYIPSGGQLNPLAYARGLARACIALGVDLHEQSPVHSLTQRGTRWLARTPTGNVQAEKVLLTTNALIGSLVPEVAASIIPARVFQIATQSFDADARHRMLPTRSPVADTRRHTFAVRWSPDDRLVSGGLVLPGPGRLARAKRIFARRLSALMKSEGTLQTPYVWTGVIAATLDSLPRFMAVAPGMDAAIGCNGRGVALTTSLGKAIAQYYAAPMRDEEFVLPHSRPISVPLHWFAKAAPNVWLPWSNLRDSLEAS